MSKTVEFLYDIGSPFSYLAHTQMPGLAARTGATVDYRPILLGGIFKATGNASPVTIAAKGAYMNDADLPRYAKRYGVTLRTHPDFPFNTLAIMRGAFAAAEDDALATYTDAMFRAMWQEMRDMNDPKEIAAALTAAGLDAQRLFARIQEQPIKDKLREATEAAVARGVFGAPTFFVGEDLFFGQDRLDFVEEALVG